MTALDPAVVAGATHAITRGSKSFASAARLFDPRTRESVVLLYAWCRHCDDVVDGQTLGFGQSARPSSRVSAGPALVPSAGKASAPSADEAAAAAAAELAAAAQRVQQLTDATLAVLRGGTPSALPFEALAEVVRRHRIPHRFPLEHLSGYGMDAEGRRYRTLADTLDYCYRVAGVVGMMMAMVMGARDDATLDRAADLGLAFQLTNIARDVLDDHAADRLYLPADWLGEEGIAAAQLADPAHRTALARVAGRLVDAAEPYYASARFGLPSLPLRSAWAVAAARGVYREIGLHVKRHGEAAWDQRIATAPRRKLHHVLAGAVTAVASKAGLREPVGPPVRREGMWNRPGRQSRA